MSEQDPPFERDPVERDREIAFLGGYTIYANRLFVQGYGTGDVRLTFAEQFTASTDIGPTFRAAVYLPKEVAFTLFELLRNQIYPPTPSVPAPKSVDKSNGTPT